MPELTFTYKNYRGEISRRRIRPSGMEIRFGSTEWHPEPQLLMLAYDLDKESFREFAVRDIDWRSEAEIAEDTWFDPDTETAWSRPTAHSYAMVCKARDRWHQEAKEWDMNVESLLGNGDADVVRVREGGGPEDLKMSLVVSVEKARKTRDQALLEVGEQVSQVITMRDTAHRALIAFWAEKGFPAYVMRAGSRDTIVEIPRISTTIGGLQDFFKSHAMPEVGHVQVETEDR